MVEILCPHCEGEIELPDDVFGEFSCPLCEEDFIWEDDSISEDESDNNAVSFIESENIELSYKLAAIAVVVVIFVIVMAISSAFSSGETDTSTWPVEQVEVVEISNEGLCCGEDRSHYRVEIKFRYDGNERSTTLLCNAERDADGYVEDNPTGTTIDIRVNPTKGESPFFEIDGGCPSVEYSTTEIVSSVACFGILIAIIGFEKIRDWTRSKSQE